MGTVTVLLMNPEEKMAAKKPARRKRRAPAPRRRPRARTSGARRARRPTRRRRNPSMPWAELGTALATGVAAGGADYALEGTSLSNASQAAVMLGVGALAGVAGSMMGGRVVGLAALAAGAAFGAKKLVKAGVAAKNAADDTPTTSGLGAAHARARMQHNRPAAMLNAVGVRAGGQDVFLNAVGIPL